MDSVWCMLDTELIHHLQEHHADDLKLKFTVRPDRTEPELVRPGLWRKFHDTLHRLSPGKYEHIHEEAKVATTPPGPSILETLWKELMRLVEGLYAGADAEDGGDKFRAEGTAYCIAVITSPYAPNIEEIRAESVRRWKAMNDDGE